MEFLDKYCDEQAMPLSELDLIKKLWSFKNSDKSFPGHKKIILNVNEKARSNHFREQTLDVPMKETLCKICGSNMFEKTQLAYHKTHFI